MPSWCDIINMITKLMKASEKGDVVNVRKLLDELATLSPSETNLDSSLILAVRNGHIAVIKALLDAGASVSEVDRNNDNVLDVAEATGRVDVMKLLVEHKADVNSAIGAKRMTVAMRAAARGDAGMLRYLVDAKASLSLVDANGWDVLDWAMEKNQTAMARTLMHEYGIDANQRSSAGIHAALVKAIVDGNVKKVKALIADGADVDAVDDVGLPVLAYAAVHTRGELAQLLVDAKAAPIPASAGLRALAERFNTQGDVMEALLLARRPPTSGPHTPPYDDMSTLHWAAKHGYADVVKLMLSVRARHDKYGKARCSALKYACENGNLAVVNMLLAARASVDEGDKHDITPLMVASEKGHFAVVQRLIAARARVNQGLDAKPEPFFREVRPALYHAVHNSHVEMVNALLAAGARVMQPGREWTIYHLAAAKGHVPVLEMVLAAGVPADVKDDKGRSALHVAARRNLADMVKVLLAAGVPMDARDDKGRTAFHSACLHGSTEAVKVLLAAGARADEVDETGLSMLAYAAVSGNPAHVRVLMDAKAAPIAASAGFTALAQQLDIPHGSPTETLLCVKSVLDLSTCEDLLLGMAPLEWAAKHGYADVVKLMLILVNTGFCDTYNTPLQSAVDHACLNGHVDVLDVFLAAGAGKPNIRTLPNWQDRLHLACRNGYATLVQRMLNTLTYDPEEMNYSQALHTAAYKGHVEVVNALLGARADAGTQVNGVSALQSAASRGHITVVKALLAAGAQVNAVVSAGWNALFFACLKGHVSVARVLLAAGACASGRDDIGLDIHTYAKASGRTEIITLLAENTAVSTAANRSTTVRAQRPLAGMASSSQQPQSLGVWQLRWAAQHNNAAIMQLLLLNPAVLRAKANLMYDALLVASEVGSIDVVNVLLDAGAWVGGSGAGKPLHHACRCGHAAVVKRLLDESADESKFYGTLLHVAARQGHAEVVRVLLDAGVPINATYDADTRDDTHTALYIASEEGHAAVVEVLLAARARVRERGSLRPPSLLAAFQGNHTNVIRAFLNASAALDAALKPGRVTIVAHIWRLAAMYGCSEVVQLLLDTGVDIDARDSEGSTALHLAALNNNKDVVTQLLAAGAHVNSKDEDGNTALHLAAKKGYYDVAKELLEGRAGVNEVDNMGFNALAYSNVKGNMEMVDLLLRAKATPMVETPQLHHLMMELGLKDSSKQSVNNGLMDHLFNLCLKCSSAKMPASKAVHWAAQRGYTDIVCLLLAAGAYGDESFTAKVEGEVTGDIAAEEDEEDDEIKWQYAPDFDDGWDEDSEEECYNPRREINEYGTTPLYEACARGYTEMVKILLAARAHVNTRSDGFTPLCVAAGNGHLAIVQRLLKAKGTNVDMECKDGFSPLHRAAERGHVAVVKALLGARANAAIESGHGRRCDVGGTALCLASAQGHAEVVQVLLDAQGDAKDMMVLIDIGNALEKAAETNKIAVVKLLVGAGVGAGIEGQFFALSLARAVHNGYTVVVDILMEAIMSLDASKQSQVLRCCSTDPYDSVKVMEVLLKAGIRDIPDNRGKTTLHIVSGQRTPDMIKLLCTYALRHLSSQ